MKDPLSSNKIAGAILTALILIFGLPQLTAALSGGHGSSKHGEALKLAYCCVEVASASTASTVEVAPVDLGTLLASATIAGGERRSALCQSCHTLDKGGADGAGPNLWDVIGRPVASTAGFNFTGALSEFGGTWTYERLDAYLKNSQELVPGTVMVQRMARDNQRADILAFLGSLSDNPVAFPEPIITEAPDDDSEASGGGLLDEAMQDATDAASQLVETANDTATQAVEEAADAMPPPE